MTPFIKDFIEKNRTYISNSDWKQVFYNWCKASGKLVPTEEKIEFSHFMDVMNSANISVNWDIKIDAMSDYLFDILEQRKIDYPNGTFIEIYQLMEVASRLHVTQETAKKLIEDATNKLHMVSTELFGCKGYTW